MTRISIDIDGVLTQQPLHKYIPTLLKTYVKSQQTGIKYLFTKAVMYIWHIPSFAIPGARDALKELKKHSFAVVLNSSRPQYLLNTTKNWLKRNNMEQDVDEIYLRETDISPIGAKMGTLVSNGIHIHFDDDLRTVQEMLKYNEVDHIYFINEDVNLYKYFVNENRVTCTETIQQAVRYVTHYTTQKQNTGNFNE